MRRRYLHACFLNFLAGLLLSGQAGADPWETTSFAIVHAKSSVGEPLRGAIDKAVSAHLDRPGWSLVSEKSGIRNCVFAEVLKDDPSFDEASLEDLCRVEAADIALRVVASVKQGPGGMTVEISVEAFEPATSVRTGVGTALSGVHPDDPAGHLAAVQEACRKLMPGIVEQILRHQEIDRKRGARFRIVVNNLPAAAHFRFVQALRKACKRVKHHSFRTKIDILAQCQADRGELLALIDDTFERHHKGVRYEVARSHRRMILITVRP